MLGCLTVFPLIVYSYMPLIRVLAILHMIKKVTLETLLLHRLSPLCRLNLTFRVATLANMQLGLDA